MKVQVPIKKLKEVISLIERTVGKNLSLPVLSAIYINIKNKQILFRTTNLSMGVEATITADTEGSGTLAVESRLLSNVVNSLSDGEKVTLKKKESTLTLNTKNNALTLKTVPHEDFPTLPKVESSASSFTLPAESLLTGIKSVYYAAAVSDIKPEISSVYIYPNDNELVFVSTDSFRLAEKKVKVKNIPEFSGIIIPYKNVIEIVRILSGVKGDVTVSFTPTQLSLQFGDTYLTSRLIDGTFPDYQQIIPKEEKTVATILKQDLQEALKMSQIFTDKFNQVSMHVSVQDKMFEIYSKNSDVGENVTKIDASLSGEEVTVNFNYRYLVDCFQSVTKDSLTLTFSGESKPLVVRGVSDRSFLYLVMPMNR